MDKIKDSGSFDASSILAGTTKIPSVTELVEVPEGILFLYFKINILLFCLLEEYSSLKNK